MAKRLADKSIAKSGFSTIKQKETWKRVGAIAGGTMLASVGVVLSNKLVGYVSSDRTFQYVAGTLSSGAVAMLCFGMKWDNAGYGAASTAAVQAINTATALVTGKSLTELTA
jgi:hypothetical protein